MTGTGFKKTLLTVYFLLFIISCIKPVYPHEMYLQHSATVAVAGLLLIATRRNNLGDRAFLCIVLFMILHIIGARWAYSDTPYNHWIKSVTGFDFDHFFGFKRNHYDRFVHFMYGLLLMVPVNEIYRRWYRFPAGAALHAAFLFILASSMVYELFEWSLTVFLSPQDADSYNGQQGDMWDSQKDMALAALGALLTGIIMKLNQKKAMEKGGSFR